MRKVSGMAQAWSQGISSCVRLLGRYARDGDGKRVEEMQKLYYSAVGRPAISGRPMAV